MKKIFLLLAIMGFVLMGCNSKDKEETENSTISRSTSAQIIGTSTQAIWVRVSVNVKVTESSRDSDNNLVLEAVVLADSYKYAENKTITIKITENVTNDSTYESLDIDALEALFTVDQKVEFRCTGIQKSDTGEVTYLSTFNEDGIVNPGSFVLIK